MMLNTSLVPKHPKFALHRTLCVCDPKKIRLWFKGTTTQLLLLITILCPVIYTNFATQDALQASSQYETLL